MTGDRSEPGARLLVVEDDSRVGMGLVVGLRKAGFGERDIWDIGAVASFYNMSNRMASAVDMRPNAEYHSQAR